jgi:DNA polymerase
MSNKTAGKLEDYLEMLKLSGIEFIPHTPQPTTQSPQASASVVPVAQQTEVKPISASGKRETLLSFRDEISTCTKCSELAQKRNRLVFGAGSAQAKLLFVGEAPGHDEDMQGLPFVGKAGQLLTKIIEAIGLTRQEVFICNVLKCRPPGNRNPQPIEIQNCEPYLIRQIEIIKRKVICALGTFAAQTLLKSQTSISALRGRFHTYQGIPLMCTFHPAYLLRNPDDKKKVWEDMKMVRQVLNAPE